MKGLMFSQALRSVLPIVMTLVLAGPAWAQVTEHKLTASDGATEDQFGYSVSLAGNRALMGAYGNDDLGTDSGSAYVYERQGDDSWLELAELTASDGAVGDRFGISVSLSVDRAIVGAFEGQSTTNGSAYVYERQQDGSWFEVAKLTPSTGPAVDAFGYKVLLSGDLAFVAAPEDDDLGLDSGAVYVYERQGDGSWPEVTKLTASDGTELGLFGFSVALSGDRIFVGAIGEGDFSGSVYEFERQGDGSWLEVAKLAASDGAEGDFFGFSVSLLGDRAFVGAFLDDDLGDGSGSAYVYKRQGDGSWLEVDKITASDGATSDFFGYSVSLSETHAIVGAYGNDYMGERSGSVYVFERQGDGSWIEVAKLNASDGSVEDLFGNSVSLSGDRALVGAHRDDDLGTDSGSAYVFENIFTVAIEPSADIPDSYHLSEPHPNPFNPQAQFSLSVSESQHVQIEVFSTLGQRVAVLHDGLLTSRGTHPFTFDAGSLPSGVYLLRVTGETFAATRTMTLLK